MGQLSAEVRWLIAILIASVVAGCASASGHGRPVQPSDVLPLDGVTYFSPAEAASLHAAEEAGVHACMRMRGLPYKVIPFPAKRYRDTNPYGLLDLEQVARDGYGLTIALIVGLQGEPPNPNDQVLHPMTASQREQWKYALLGTSEHQRKTQMPGGNVIRHPGDGCVYEARRRLYGPQWEELRIKFEGLSNLVISKTQIQPAYLRALRQWSICMKSAGYEVSTLQNPREMIYTRLTALGNNSSANLHTIGKLELVLAEADAHCQQTAGLHQTTQAAQSEFEGPIRRRYGITLATFRKLRSEALTRAPGLKASAEELAEHR